MKQMKLLCALIGASLVMTLWADIQMTEICPRPDALDPNGKEGGWIELTNVGEETDNLSNYALIRWNRGKENKKKKRLVLCDRELAPGERTLVYTSEAYENYWDSGKVEVYDNDVMVYPSKVNPKKFPNVALYESDQETLVQTFIVPVDLEDDKSFGPGASTKQVSLIDEATPYTYAFADEADTTYEGDGRLVVGTYALPSDLTAGLEALEMALDSGVVITNDVAATLDTNGVLQPTAYDFSAVTTTNTGIVGTPTNRAAKYYTVSLWFRSNPSEETVQEGSSNHGMPLFECRPSGDGDRTGMIVFLNEANQITVQPRNTINNVTLTSDTEADYADNNWHHLVLVAGQSEGDNLTLYIDGQAEIASTLPFDCALQESIPYHFGRAQNSTSWYKFKGQLADIRFYHYELSADEVANLIAENKADREVTSQYGGLETRTNSTTVNYLTYDSETDTYTFAIADADYASNVAYIENADQTADAYCAIGETLDFWVKPTSFGATGSEAVVLMDSRAGSQGEDGYLLLVGTNSDTKYQKIYVQRGGGTKINVEFENQSTLPLNEWMHVTFAIDATTAEASLYLNGVLVDTQTITNYTPATTTRRFGGTHDKYWRGFRGEMAEIKIFSGVLPTREVAKLHNASGLADSQVTEAGADTSAGTYHSKTELVTTTGEMTITLPEYTEGSTLTFSAIDTIGGLTLAWNGAEITLNEAITLDATNPITEGILTWTLTPSSTDLQRMAVELTATLTLPITGETRAIFNVLTPGEANDLTGAIPYGPNIGPANTTVYEDFGYYLPEATATPNTDYTICLDVQPLADDEENAIAKVELMYRSAFGEVKYVDTTYTESIFHRVLEEENDDGEEVEVDYYEPAYVGIIPAEDIPEAGQLIQFGARITDAAGRQWISPSRNNPDDCPLWYGTIVTPDGLLSETLQTFHLFVEGDNLTLMDKDYDAVKGTYPLGARCGIYDSQTDTYYDNVRIDLRGNTSAGFAKKSHGLRFSKCQPLSCKNKLEGTKIKEVRKTSFTSEFADPTYIRQGLSFYVWRNVGNKVPFHYPVRLNLNGEFYQLAFHSNRFTDELIEDYYGLDPMGYGYKNVGTISPNTSTTAGSVEKKTPDDGDETSSAAYAPLEAWAKTFSSSVNCPENDETLTGVVYDTFDIPAWINYLATARITQEADDIWANICLYWDKNGNDVWMPLAYDHNLSWGAWYYGDDTAQGRIGLRPADDEFKSHPFYSGWKVRAHKASGSIVGNGNYAVEALWQNADFREMYLRRLRTLMDEVLKEPGTAKEDTPFWTNYVEKFKTAVTAEAELDRAKWGTSYASTVIYVWDHILEWDEAFTDLWDNYVEPRRKHLFETHNINNVTNETWEIGYDSNMNAGIPDAQSADFAPILIEKVDGGVKLTNPNTESIDLSNWTVEGLMDVSTLPEDSEDIFTLPPGTVLLGGKSLILAYDRKAYVAANEPCFVIGLAVYGDDKVWIPEANTEATAVTLTKADGEVAVDNLVDAEVIAWLSEAIQSGTITAANLKSVSAATDYAMAYLLNESPATGIADETELSISAFGIDTEGNITLTVALKIGELVKEGTINGQIKLYAKASLDETDWTDVTDGTNQTFTNSEMDLRPLTPEDPGIEVPDWKPVFFKARLSK